MNGSLRVARTRRRAQRQLEARASVATKAVGYVRVSTEEQATTGFGLSTQEAAIRAFAESQGYELVQIISDAGVSGATKPNERPGFSQITAMAERGEVSVLLVWKFDRLARQIVYAVTAANDLAERLGVNLRSVTEPIDSSTPMGKTMFAILAGMAEQERQSITERTFLGRREKASRGGFAGGAAPLGYSRSPDGHLEIDEMNAETVRRVFALRKAGRTLVEIAATLNAERVRTARGGRWWPGTVRYLLDNPKYRGASEYLFRAIGAETHVLHEGTHAAIVPEY